MASSDIPLRRLNAAPEGRYRIGARSVRYRICARSVRYRIGARPVRYRVDREIGEGG